MDTETVRGTLAALGREVEDQLGRCFKERGFPAGLLEAMEYSLLAGGKRVRPVLCLAFAELSGLGRGPALPFACGLECIHTYSLIHDDLPAMDDDDLRRGRPSSHKAFGEAVAILAGDGLLTEAFGLMAATPGLPPERVLRAVAEVARAAGAAGMVGGQALDIGCAGRRDVSLPELRRMQALKTGALIECACVSGAILAGAAEADAARARRYGREVGAAFQIADDILGEVGDERRLGKPVGSDRAKGKVTFVSVAGLAASREMAQAHAAGAVESLAPYQGDMAGFLRGLARYVVERVC